MAWQQLCNLCPTSAPLQCNCQPGFVGVRCDQRQKPCADNPCESRGECFEKNGGFFCRCHAWWEGARCEKRMMHIPYKPLSERMLQEPFWLGLITVFVVLAVIGLVWCAKRHFPEKIEKLLADDTQLNRSKVLGGRTGPTHLDTTGRCLFYLSFSLFLSISIYLLSLRLLAPHCFCFVTFRVPPSQAPSRRTISTLPCASSCRLPPVPFPPRTPLPPHRTGQSLDDWV